MTKQTLLLYHPVLFFLSFFLFLRSCAEPHRQDTMTCASGGVNSSLLYAEPQSSARGRRAHLQQDVFSFTPDRNTMLQSHFMPASRWQCYISGWHTNTVCTAHRHMKPTENPLRWRIPAMLVNCSLIHRLLYNAVQNPEYAIWNDNCIIVIWCHCVACLIQGVSSSSHQKFHFKSNSSLSAGAECAVAHFGKMKN